MGREQEDLGCQVIQGRLKSCFANASSASSPLRGATMFEDEEEADCEGSATAEPRGTQTLVSNEEDAAAVAGKASRLATITGSAFSI